MNEATKEYLALLQRAHNSAMREVARYDDASAYYPCMTGALRALLGMEIERRFEQAIDSTAEREQSGQHDEERRGALQAKETAA